METEARLTKLASCAGCGAKVGAGTLSKLLQDFKTRTDPEPISYFANAMLFIFECSFSCRPARSSEKVAEWKTGTEVYVFSHPKGWYEIEYDGIHRL